MTNMRKLWVNVEVMVHETKSYNFEKEISRIAFEKKKTFWSCWYWTTCQQGISMEACVNSLAVEQE